MEKGSENAIAYYSHFSILDESDSYKLTVTGFDNIVSTAGDSMSLNNGMKFTTKDVKNDLKPLSENCA